MIKVTHLPGPKTSAILKDKFQKYMGLYDPPYPFVYKEGQGVYVKDLDGNVFMDWASQIAVQPLGYNHPAMVETLSKYQGKGTFKLAGHDFFSEEHAELIEELIKITPEKLNAAFLINSGAEAVENAAKIAYRKRPSAKTAVSFQGAFHGRTLGALSLTNSKYVQKKNYPEIPVRRLQHFTSSEKGISEFERVLKYDLSPENIAFVIVECIQGEGGYRFAEKEFIKELRRITQENQIPLIIDEVQAGMGRTGKWWSFQHYDVEPDIMTSAKALQVGATIANKETFPTDSGSISSTYGGGHLLDMAMGATIIKTIKKDKLLENCTKMGEYMLKRLKELEERYKIVGNARGLGLMIAIDFPNSELRNKVVDLNFQKGLLTLGCGSNGLRIIPPYIINKEEIDEGIKVLETSIREAL